MQTSYKNVGEAQILANQIRALIVSGLSPEDIGVITPYKSQVDHIKHLLRKSSLLSVFLIVIHFVLDDIPNIKVSSVDAFQGQEREVICMSLVRSRRTNIELGFLTDLRRMNVSY